MSLSVSALRHCIRDQGLGHGSGSAFVLLFFGNPDFLFWCWNVVVWVAIFVLLGLVFDALRAIG